MSFACSLKYSVRHSSSDVHHSRAFRNGIGVLGCRRSEQQSEIGSHEPWISITRSRHFMYNSSKSFPKRIAIKAGSDEPGSMDSIWHQSALFIECDGALMDVHMDGHRVAFNRALEELGYSCAHWTPAVYTDLLRWGDGTGTGLIKAYYSMVGWPIMVSTKERPDFVNNIYGTKQRIFQEMINSGDIPLREGAVEILDDAISDGVKPVILAATASDPQDRAISCAMLNLGPSRATKIQVLQVVPDTPEAIDEDSNIDSKEDDFENDTVSFEQEVKMAESKAKTQAAASFTRAMNLQNRGVGMMVDPTLRAAKERAGIADPAYFAAILAALGCKASYSALIAANQSVSEGAQGAGLFVAGVPPSLAARGGYSAMDAKFDGMGPGALTWRKLRALIERRLESEGK